MRLYKQAIKDFALWEHFGSLLPHLDVAEAANVVIVENK